jgi:hypothetical protein
MASVYAAVENVFDSLGMMQGTLAPVKRAVFGAGVGYVLVKAIQPASMFYEDGTPRPWAWSQTGANYDGSGTGQHSAVVPYWAVPAAGAAIGGLFI